jgi:cytochrome c-type biogenesis protein CcmH
VLNALLVLLAAAVLTAAAAFWVLRAYRRAGGGARSATPALGACGAVAIVALVAYLAIGRPEMPDAPYAERLNTLIAAVRSPTPPMLRPDEELAIWTHFSRQQPNDVTPHLHAAGLLLGLGRAREAAVEYDKVLRLQPESADALLGMGRALVSIEGRVTPEAQAYFVQAGERSNDPAPWIYQAMVAMQEDNLPDSQRLWGEALRRMRPGDPRRAMAERFSHGQFEGP